MRACATTYQAICGVAREEKVLHGHWRIWEHRSISMTCSKNDLS